MGYGHPTRAEINLSAIRANIRNVRSLLAPSTRYCAVVKADGYGHGAIPVAREALALGAEYLGVAFLPEALALRDAGITAPILILGFTPPALAPLTVAHMLTQTIYTREQAEALSLAAEASGRTLNVHVKINTGMNRLGIPPEEAADFCAYVASLRRIALEGLFTHFATADSLDKSMTRTQFSCFCAAVNAIKERGIAVPLCHCANSAALLDLPDMHLDMVRAGIIQYGLRPSSETTEPFTPRPAMRLKTRIAQLTAIPAGASVSYGAIFTAARPTTVATLPIGYADGYPRLLSGKAQIAVAGRKAPLIGRICMDQCMADVTDIEDLHEGSEVTLFGGDGVSADDIAACLGTISYEIVCMVGKRVPRVYLQD